MAVEDGTVRIQQNGQAICCHVRGRATMRQGPAFRQAVEAAIAHGLLVLRVDLRECTYMDSTFLGLLIMIRRILAARPEGRLELLSPSPECCRLIHQMGLHGVFLVVAAEEPILDASWISLESERDDYAFKRNVVEAHQELASVPGPVSNRFREVAAHLTKEWEREQGALR